VSILQKELQGGRSMNGSLRRISFNLYLFLVGYVFYNSDSRKTGVAYFESFTNSITSCSSRSKKMRSLGDSNASKSFSSGFWL